jgi:hypothetical protein
MTSCSKRHIRGRYIRLERFQDRVWPARIPALDSLEREFTQTWSRQRRPAKSLAASSTSDESNLGRSTLFWNLYEKSAVSGGAHGPASTAALSWAPVVGGESNRSFCSFLGMCLVLQNPNSAYADDQCMLSLSPRAPNSNLRLCNLPLRCATRLCSASNHFAHSMQYH